MAEHSNSGIDAGLVAEAEQLRSDLWYTSRSTYERGTQHCPFARYVEYHAGPYGYGLSRKAMSLPLVTGTYAHQGITDVLQWVLDATEHTGSQPESVPDEVIRWAAERAVEQYREVCHKRGILTYAQDDPESLAKLQYLILEQEHLIAGLTWAWCLTRLPIYLRDYTILEVEGEQEYVIGCTCGLGNGIGSFEEHELRGCVGIGVQSKPDFLCIRKADGAAGYVEFKTASMANRGLNSSWERKPQFILGMLGAERKHGKTFTHAWVETLVKGKRDRERPYKAENPKLQQSMLCHAYYAPPNPPMSEGSWRPGYNYTTALGEEFIADRKSGYRKSALWTPPQMEAWPGLPMVDRGDGTTELMSVSEYWVKTLQAEYPTHLDKCIAPIGPLPRNDEQIEKALRGFLAEENLWRDRLWRIYEFSQEHGVEWGDDEFHAFVETVVPRSWHCDPFADHPCGNQPICHPVTEDWRRPVESELFVYRTPHHRAELEQIQKRGLTPPSAALAVEEGEQEDVE